MAADAETGAAPVRTNAIPVTYHNCLSVVLSSLKVKILRHAATHAATRETSGEAPEVTKADVLESARTILPTALADLEQALDAAEPDPVYSVS